MSVYKMNTDQIVKFVNLYKECECLWDVNSVKYRDRASRDQALKRISDEMNIAGFGLREVAQKIKNVRTTYKQEVQKIMRSIATVSSPDDIYKPNLPWFKTADSFLKGLQPKLPWFKTADSFLKGLQKTPPSNFQNTGVATERSTSCSSYNDDNDEFHEEISLEPSYSLNVGEPISLESSSRKRKWNSEEYVQPSYSPEVLDRFMVQEARTGYVETEFDLWARSLAVQLNGMDVSRALKLQLQIQTFVTNERLEYEMNKLASVPSSSRQCTPVQLVEIHSLSDHRSSPQS